MKVLVLFYSAYGHNWEMAQSVADGVKSIDGVEVDIKKVPETLPQELLDKIGISQAQKAWEHIPVAEPNELADYDAIIFGAPTRFGMMAAQMKSFLDSTGGIWAKGALVGKIGSVFTSSNTQHGGQESTILNFHTVLLHHGMLIAGLPYTLKVNPCPMKSPVARPMAHPQLPVQMDRDALQRMNSAAHFIKESM